VPETSISEGSLIAGRYRLERLLGEGGMGRVWSATHTVTRRAVAIKFLKEAVQHKPDLKQRFLREASAASSLRHPNVVEVIDVFDLEDQTPVMVMELLEGETLGAKLAREERLSTEETAAIMIPVVAAVTVAHSMGVVHRDLKPENIFISKTGGPAGIKVLDFGIAKLSAEHYLQLGQSVLETEAGAILGTPCYMAPEQLSGSGVDHLADIWSLGVILYECLSGTRPVEGRNLAEVIARLMNGAITPLERLAPELPHEVSAIVQQMLSRDLKRRPQDLSELTKMLGRYSHVRVSAVPPTPTVVSGVDRLPEPTPGSRKPRKPEAPNRTMQSAPALGLDTAPVDSTDPTSSTPATPENRKRALPMLYAFGAGGVVAVVVILGLFSRPSAQPSSTATGQPSALATPAQTPAAVIPTASAALPTATASASAPGSAPQASASSTAKTAPDRTTAGAKRPSTSPSPRPPATSTTKGESSDGVLFSGRK
jgi:serine/threonine protein kinase